MRTITFDVTQQKIKPTNSISHIYKGTDNYLKLEFAFDENWNDCKIGIVFKYKGKTEEFADVLKNNAYVVPNKAFDDSRLTFYLVGKNKAKNYRIQSQTFVVRIGG